MAYYRVLLSIFVVVSIISAIFLKSSLDLLFIQCLTLIIGNFIARISAVRRLVISEDEMSIAVHQYATYLMGAKGVVNRDDRRGILIFVSKFERQIEVIADIGITKTVGQEQLQTISNAIGAKMRTNEDEALADGIKAAEKILAEL